MSRLLPKKRRPDRISQPYIGDRFERVRRLEIDRQAGLPRLCDPARVVQHLRRRRQPVEVVPFLLQKADRLPRLEFQRHPIHIITLELEQLVELLLAAPMPQLRAVEQHHARGEIAVQALRSVALPTHDGGTLHVAGQQLPNIGNGENVRDR